MFVTFVAAAWLLFFVFVGVQLARFVIWLGKSALRLFGIDQ